MRFYHTSNVIVSEPDVYHSRKHLVIDKYLQFVESITL